MIRLRVLEILKEKGHTKYWLYKNIIVILWSKK